MTYLFHVFGEDVNQRDATLRVFPQQIEPAQSWGIVGVVIHVPNVRRQIQHTRAPRHTRTPCIRTESKSTDLSIGRNNDLDQNSLLSNSVTIVDEIYIRKTTRLLVFSKTKLSEGKHDKNEEKKCVYSYFDIWILSKQWS